MGSADVLRSLASACYRVMIWALAAAVAGSFAPSFPERREAIWAKAPAPGSEGLAVKLLLWLLLLVFAWPLALLAIILYPLVWLVSLPFRLVGISVQGLFDLLDAIVRLPARALRGRPSA